MKQRNWLDLSRKLVDRYDFNYTLEGMSEILGKYALSFFGEGVLITTTFPNPFPITLSGSVLGGSVGTGIAYDDEGNFTSIQSGTSPFTIPTAHSSLARWDLLVLRYKQNGDSLVPKPSDPITMVYLNLLDGFELIIRPGTPNASPAYPAEQAGDIILAGIKVPAGATLGTQCVADLSIRETGIADTVKLPVIKQEAMVGVVNGSNTIFTITEAPMVGSVIVFLSGQGKYKTADYSVSGQTITFATAPVLGQEPYAYYVVLDEASINPLSIVQEVPVGVVDSSNDTFTLAGQPVNKNSMLVFVDGFAVKITEFSLIEGPSNHQIKFAPGSIPVLGQSLYCLFFVNSATVGVAPSGGGGGGGSYVPYGSVGAPVIVDPSAGILSSADDRQLVFVSSMAGVVPVTANPQITPGSDVGQEMLLKGGSNTNYMTLADGNGLSLNGGIQLILNQTLQLFWNGSVWEEISRRY